MKKLGSKQRGFWKALIGAGATLLGGRMTGRGQEDANKKNLQIAREQMTFQERMSNTAYQRSAQDLEKAGLNRILALGSPASSPPGALATMQNEMAAPGEAIQEAPHSAMAMKNAIAQVKNINAATAKAKAEEKLTTSQETLIEDTRSQIQQTVKQIVETTRHTSAQSVKTETEADIWQRLGQLIDPILQKIDSKSGTGQTARPGRHKTPPKWKGKLNRNPDRMSDIIIDRGQ